MKQMHTSWHTLKKLRSSFQGVAAFFYDASCNRCSNFAQWLQKKDFSQRILLIPLQHPHTAKILPQFHPPFESAIWLTSSQLHTNSDAILLALQTLPNPWHTIAKILQRIPPNVRNFCYQQISHHRYL